MVFVDEVGTEKTEIIEEETSIGDIGFLKALEEKKTSEAFFQYLCQNADWVVRPYDKNLITAEKRRFGAALTVEENQANVRIDFDKSLFYHRHAYERKYAAVRTQKKENKTSSFCPANPKGETIIAPDDKSARLLVEHSFLKNNYESTLFIRAGNVVFAINETGPDRVRKATGPLIKSLMSEVKECLEEIAKNGSCKKLLPPISISSNGPEIKIEKAKDKMDGIYVMSGHINKGEPGYVLLKTFNMETGDEISKHKNEIDAAEFVGWSDQPDEFFYFERDFSIDGFGMEMPVKFEVRFYPLEKYEVLYDKTETVRTWVR